MTKESPTSTILRIGHRGACGHAPENTLASIEEAIVLRCALTEVDIQRTSDDELVLLHDERVGPLKKAHKIARATLHYGGRSPAIGD